MNLQSLTKQNLLAETEKLVADERRITTAILWHLYEIERRRLYAELGFASLFEYCTVQLKYSAASAQRRITSMRLLREMPEIASKIDSGELNVTALSQAQTMFQQAKMENKTFALHAKKDLISKLENKTQRECERILADISPELSRPSRERVISSTKTEIRLEADEELYSKIQTLKGKYAHKLKGSNDFAKLLEILVDIALEAKPKHSVPALEVKTKKSGSLLSDRENISQQIVPAPEVKSTTSRYIPVAIKQDAIERSQNQCTYTYPSTGRRCTSNFALEFDHIQPLALGGRTEYGNIRVLCRVHNQFEAVRKLGPEKMRRYMC